MCAGVRLYDGTGKLVFVAEEKACYGSVCILEAVITHSDVQKISRTLFIRQNTIKSTVVRTMLNFIIIIFGCFSLQASG